MYKVTKTEKVVIEEALNIFGFIEVRYSNGTFIFVYKTHNLVNEYGSQLLTYVRNKLPNVKWYCTSEEALDIMRHNDFDTYVEIGVLFTIHSWTRDVEIVDD